MLPDAPAEPWPDRTLLDDAKMLRTTRSAATAFAQEGLVARHQASDGSLFFAMRQHVLAWDEGKKKWSPDPAPKPVPANLADRLAAVFCCDSAESIDIA